MYGRTLVEQDVHLSTPCSLAGTKVLSPSSSATENRAPGTEFRTGLLLLFIENMLRMVSPRLPISRDSRPGTVDTESEGAPSADAPKPEGTRCDPVLSSNNRPGTSGRWFQPRFCPLKTDGGGESTVENESAGTCPGCQCDLSSRIVSSPSSEMEVRDRDDTLLGAHTLARTSFELLERRPSEPPIELRSVSAASVTSALAISGVDARLTLGFPRRERRLSATDNCPRRRRRRDVRQIPPTTNSKTRHMVPTKKNSAHRQIREEQVYIPAIPAFAPVERPWNSFSCVPGLDETLDASVVSVVVAKT